MLKMSYAGPGPAAISAQFTLKICVAAGNRLVCGGVALWHCAKNPAPQRGPAVMAVIAATDDGSMISLNNFHRLMDELLSELKLN